MNNADTLRRAAEHLDWLSTAIMSDEAATLAASLRAMAEAELTDRQIQDAVFAVLRRWKDDRAWDRYTRESGPYDVSSIRPELLEIIRAVLDAAIDAARGAGEGVAGVATDQPGREGD